LDKNVCGFLQNQVAKHNEVCQLLFKLHCFDTYKFL